MRFQVVFEDYDGDSVDPPKDVLWKLEGYAYQDSSKEIITQWVNEWNLPSKTITEVIKTEETENGKLKVTRTIPNPKRILWEEDFYSHGTDHAYVSGPYGHYSRKIEDPELYWFVNVDDLGELMDLYDLFNADKITFTPDKIIILVS